MRWRAVTWRLVWNSIPCKSLFHSPITWGCLQRSPFVPPPGEPWEDCPIGHVLHPLLAWSLLPFFVRQDALRVYSLLWKRGAAPNEAHHNRTTVTEGLIEQTASEKTAFGSCYGLGAWMILACGFIQSTILSLLSLTHISLLLSLMDKLRGVVSRSCSTLPWPTPCCVPSSSAYLWAWMYWK